MSACCPSFVLYVMCFYSSTFASSWSDGKAVICDCASSSWSDGKAVICDCASSPGRMGRL